MKKHLVIVFIIISQLINSQSIESNKRIKNDSIYIDLINVFYAPIVINMSPLKSSEEFVRVKQKSLLKHRDTLKNALVIPINKVVDTTKIDIKKFVSFDGAFGDPKSKIDTDYEYYLPFPKGKRYKIIQTFGGRFSHRQKNSMYAVDIGLKVGDTITATRPGIVFYSKEDSKKHCGNIKCNAMANNILIMHDDGSIAHYVHLNFQGVLVEVGDRVELDQPIGISGMTGFTTIPHLHFVIYKSGNISIPFRFKGQNTKALKKNWFYRRTY